MSLLKVFKYAPLNKTYVCTPINSWIESKTINCECFSHPNFPLCGAFHTYVHTVCILIYWCNHSIHVDVYILHNIMYVRTYVYIGIPGFYWPIRSPGFKSSQPVRVSKESTKCLTCMHIIYLLYVYTYTHMTVLAKPAYVHNM